jgi:DNA processing protein
MSGAATAGPSPSRGSGACLTCRRRSWLLGNLSPLLDYHRGDPAKLRALLTLAGDVLIAALAGRRRDELSRAYRELDPALLGGPAEGGALCAHSGSWPAGLDGAERMLWLTAPQSRFERLLEAPAVAIIGGPAASPYGVQMTAALARGLAAAGVRVVAGLTGELAQTAHDGVREARGASLAVAGDGLGRVRPAGAAGLARELARSGCLVAELPADASGRGWGAVAAEQTVVALGDVTIVVEAEIGAPATVVARTALAEGRAIGAVPGPVTSYLSSGPHSLLLDGARLIRDPHDALELLYESSPERPTLETPSAFSPELQPRLREVLERVGSGEDTPERITRGAADPGDALAALGELEASGLVKRLPGGRYAAREATRRSPEAG